MLLRCSIVSMINIDNFALSYSRPGIALHPDDSQCFSTVSLNAQVQDISKIISNESCLRNILPSDTFALYVRQDIMVVSVKLLVVSALDTMKVFYLPYLCSEEVSN